MAIEVGDDQVRLEPGDFLDARLRAQAHGFPLADGLAHAGQHAVGVAIIGGADRRNVNGGEAIEKGELQHYHALGRIGQMHCVLAVVEVDGGSVQYAGGERQDAGGKDRDGAQHWHDRYLGVKTPQLDRLGKTAGTIPYQGSVIKKHSH